MSFFDNNNKKNGYSIRILDDGMLAISGIVAETYCLCDCNTE